MRNRFRSVHIVFHNLGSLLLILTGALLLPLMMILYHGHPDQHLRSVLAFAVPIVISLLGGLVLRYFFKPGNPNSIQAMLLCSLGWIVFSGIGALPYVIGIGCSYISGYFEAMSGFTTTGITMYTGLDEMPASIIFWRALTQWIGGLGILTFFLAISYRGAGAHWLFGAESHKIDVRRPVPGLAHTLAILWGIYTGFTVLILLGLHIAGMSLFDSVCHSFTALSTGGFSPHDASIEYYRIAGSYRHVWFEYILIFGMLLGGTNFLVHYRLLKGSFKSLFDNVEMRYWWFFILCFISIIMLERYLHIEQRTHAVFGSRPFFTQLEENFRLVSFQVVSIITTTGFGTKDIGTPFFGVAAKQLFLIMMVIGGCVGSTGGGIKVLRISILIQVIRRELFRMRVPPRAISAVIIDGKPVGHDEICRVTGLFFTWMVLLVFGGLTTALLSRWDAVQSLSGMFSALGNIGPCYIPVEEMGVLHPFVKITYIIGMLAGRLEILPVLLFFSPRAWKG